jgi:hypothetical protein
MAGGECRGGAPEGGRASHREPRCRASGNWRTMRLSALRLPSFVSLLSYAWWVVSKARTHECAARAIVFYPPPHAVRGRGIARRAVEGACGGAASGEFVAPSTTLLRRRSPFPASRGRMKCASLRASAKQSRAACAELDCFVADALRNDEDLKCARHKLVIRALPVFLICWANWPEA